MMAQSLIDQERMEQEEQNLLKRPYMNPHLATLTQIEDESIDSI